MIKNFSLNEKKPLLGICLGMQLLLSKSFEFGEHSGLNLIPGEVIKLSFKDKKNKIPHIGWKSVFFKEKNIIFDKKFDKKNFTLSILSRFKQKILIIQSQHVNIMKEILHQ